LIKIGQGIYAKAQTAANGEIRSILIGDRYNTIHEFQKYTTTNWLELYE